MMVATLLAVQNVVLGLVCGSHCGAFLSSCDSLILLAVYLHIKYYYFNERINFSYVLDSTKIINDIANFN